MTDAERVSLGVAMFVIFEVCARAQACEVLRTVEPAPMPGPVPGRSLLGRLVGRTKPSPEPEPDPDASLRMAFARGLHARAIDVERLLPEAAAEIFSTMVAACEADFPEHLHDKWSRVTVRAFESAWRNVFGVPPTQWGHMPGPDFAAWRSHAPRPVRRLLSTLRLPGVDPVRSASRGPADESFYDACWIDLADNLKRLPRVEAVGWRIWLDALDSVFEICLAKVPRDFRTLDAVDSLIDHARLAAASAASLVRLSHEDGPPPSEVFRLVSIEFTPIQDFIFGIAPDSPWPGHLAVSGRSAFVRLLVDVAALLLLDRMGLPPACLLNSAASKATLLVPNSDWARQVLRNAVGEFDRWSLRQLTGGGGLCIGHVGVSERLFDVSEPGVFQQALRNLSQRVEQRKLRRFDLDLVSYSPVLSEWSHDVERAGAFCSLDGVNAGSKVHERDLLELLDGPADASVALGASARMQLRLAARLKDTHVLTIRKTTDAKGWHAWGLTVALSGESVTVDPQTHLADWDISHALRVGSKRTGGLAIRPIALHAGQSYKGPRAALKGDVDRLGQLFREGIPQPGFARSIALSRELDRFFAVEVPQLLRTNDFDTVQVLVCGGDDFLMLGPPDVIVRLASELQQAFAAYCANPVVSFSIGISIGDANASMTDLVNAAEDAIAEAKTCRNAIHVHGVTLGWADTGDAGSLGWFQLCAIEEGLRVQLARHCQKRVQARDHVRGRNRVAQMLTARRDFLHALLQIVDSLDEIQGFLGARWRAGLHDAITNFVRAGGSNRDLEDASIQAELVEAAGALIDLLETPMERHGRSLRVVALNLLQRVDDGLFQERLPAAVPVNRREPVRASPTGPWRDLSDRALFGQVAFDLAASLSETDGDALRVLMADFRRWDAHVDQHDDRLVWHRPMMIESVSTDAGLAALRRCFVEQSGDAAALHRMRYLAETVCTFHLTRRWRTPSRAETA